MVRESLNSCAGCVSGALGRNRTSVPLHGQQPGVARGLCLGRTQMRELAVVLTRLSEPDFRAAYGNEEQCRALLERLRWPDGFVCPACGHRGAIPLTTRP